MKAGMITPQAELALVNGKVVRPDGCSQAILTRGSRISAIGSTADIKGLTSETTKVVDLRGRTIVPGLIDGHAHMDREGLKVVLPSLSGAAGIDDIVDAIAAIAATKKPGEWIVTMPIGEPPTYENVPDSLKEKRFPTRWDLDRAAPDNPVYIRSIWGYWRSSFPLVSVANSAALRCAGIDANTIAPAASVQIGRDPQTGEPDGIFYEWNKMPVVELSLMSCAPNFTRADREAALLESMRIYNSFGTTGVFEGHGIAGDVLAAYQQARQSGAQTVRASLAFSPVWRSTSLEDCVELLRSWGQWLAGRGLGDEWLRVQGMFCEADESHERQLRSAAFPQTGWAGFHYQASLPPKIMTPLLVEAARNGIRVVGIWPDTLDLFSEVNEAAPIAGQRWVLGHLFSLTADEVKKVRDLGLVVTTHLSAYVYKRGAQLRKQLGEARQNEIVPLRSLLDAGVPVSFGSDNVPPSLFASVQHAVTRRERGGAVIAPDQAISREEAIQCASHGGAHLTYEEHEKGSLAPGKLADFVVLSNDPLSCREEELADIIADMTIVDGKIVFDRLADKQIESL